MSTLRTVPEVDDADPAGELSAVEIDGCAVVDLAAATVAARQFLIALGADLGRPGLDDTPRRIAAAYAEMLTPLPFDVTTFPNDEAYDELVLARAIPFSSLCEHHALPFIGVAHVGYIPGDRLVGLSKLGRVVELFARRLQVQERLTTQISGWLQEQLDPLGVGVVIEAEHLCMSLRGARVAGTRTTTSSVTGVLREDGRARNEFFALTRGDRR